jgi:hypothetical protein
MVENYKDELKRQWPFLRSVCNVGWFKPLLFGQPGKINSVCDEELATEEERMFDEIVQSQYKSAGTSDTPLLVPSGVRRLTEEQLTKLFETPEPISELAKWRQEWDERERLKKENRDLLRDLRNKHTALKGETFVDYYKSLADEAARLLIYKRLALNQAQEKLDAWRSQPQLFPHFSAFLEVSIFSLYDADRNQNSKLDMNWQADAEQLCFLVDVDMIVSSDEKFMKRAFDSLWYPKGKQMLTPKEFVKLLPGL